MLQEKNTLNDAPIVENGASKNREKEVGNDNGGAEKEPKNQGEVLKDAMGRLEEDRAFVATLREDAEKTRNVLEQLSKAIPMEADRESTASDAALEEQMQSLEMEEERLEKMEREFLDAPPAAEGDETEEEPEQRSYEQQAQTEQHQTEKEKREQREKFVQKFIENGIAYMKEHFAKEFSSCANGTKAQDLMETKIRFDLQKQLLKYIEHGGASVGFHVALHMHHFDTPDGTTTIYITGVDVEWSKDPDVEKLHVDDELTNKEETEELKRAEEKDELEEEKKEAA